MTSVDSSVGVDLPTSPAQSREQRADRLASRGVRGRRLPATALRLAGFHALVLAAVLALVVFGLYRAFTGDSKATTTRNLVAEARGYAAAAQARPTNQDLRLFSEGYLRTHVLPDGEVVIVSLPNVGLIGSTGSGALLASAPVQRWAARPPTSTDLRRDSVANKHFEFVAVPMHSGSRNVGTVIAVADLSHTLADRAHVLRLAVGEALIALLVGVAGVYLLLRRLLRTVGRITATAAGISRGELDRRLGDQGTDDEVGQLAATFDDMADRLATAMTSQRQLLSDVSHQLRTPLTVARGHLEVLSRTDAENPAEVRQTVTLVVDELDHMRSLVERLLLLGRSLEPDFLEPVPIDLRSMVAEVIEAARVLAPRKWQRADVPDLVLLADPAKLRGALLNLIDNAVHATKRGNRIAVVVERSTDGSVVLAVDDAGGGIPPDERASVLARFERPGASDADGSGLGLAIVKAVAEAHGGRVEIGDSSLGGCRVAIVLPPTVVVVDES